MAPKADSAPAIAAAPIAIASRPSGVTSNKIGYTLLFFSLGLLGIGYLMPVIQDSSDPEQQRLYGSIAVFWVMLMVGVCKGFIWPDEKRAAPAASSGAQAGGGAEEDEDSGAGRGASRRTRRA
ncbi:hypothetical protein HYH03_004877 [Edaphochlamys debaryana]|uniref:Uncharacterized protein n=1 Tax=Edaphochlamys debaryana TaxID=47281 RepID=A0A835Y8W9_9CHLO|nr:hypothetical protein HYH03_004877 [Edaphochlamys debaryana]|eukprot:KAG2497294.1 hypothetical protein HYH03_004877 [Edaphochlamys debaryana]